VGSEDSHSGMTDDDPAKPPARDRAVTSEADDSQTQPAATSDADRTVAFPVSGAGSAAGSGVSGAASEGDRAVAVPGSDGERTVAFPVSGAVPPAPGAGPADAPPPQRPRRPNRLVVVLAGVLVLVLGAAGVAVVRSGPVASWLGTSPTTRAADADPTEPPPPPVLAPAAANAPAPTPDGVRAALDPLVGNGALGDAVNISVVDPASGVVLYEQGQETPTVPASTAKLVTAATALVARGPAYRITTRVVAGARPGEVVVVGAGDPTLAVTGTGWYPGAGRLDDLAEQVKKALGATKPTRVIVDGSLFSGPEVGPGWDSDATTGGFGAKITAFMTDGARINPKDPGRGQARHSDPDMAAGRAFAKLLGLPASAVAEGTAPAGGTTASTGPGPGGDVPAPGTELGRVESPPLLRLVEFMLEDSDNVIAEALARQVALARGRPASFEAAATAMNEVVAELGLPAEESHLVDGSGLSRANRLTPGLLTDLLTLAARGTRPELGALFSGMPVAAWSGSLRDRYGDAHPTATGAGTVRAKTGTLSGVHAISGVVTTADGRLLVFAILADRVPGGTDEARVALDRIASALAACGCR